MSADSFFQTETNSDVILRLIHESKSGAFCVYTYTRKGSLRVSVFKTLRRGAEEDEIAPVMLRREFDILASLQHPGIISVYDWSTIEEKEGISMQYADGITLSSAMASSEFDAAKRRRCIMWLLDALEYLHSKGFVHRDLKPDNIIVDINTGDVKIIDFGLACRSGNEPVKCGTKGFSAPEQLAGSAAADFSADIYSFGVILAKMFPKGEWGKVAHRCMASSVEQRPASIAQVRKMLGRRVLPVIGWVVGALSVVVILAVAVPHIFKKESEPVFSGDVAVAESALTDVEDTVSANVANPMQQITPENEKKEDLPNVADQEKRVEGSNSAAKEVSSTVEKPEIAPAVSRDMMEKKLETYVKDIVAKGFKKNLEALEHSTDEKVMERALTDAWVDDVRRDMNSWVEQNVPAAEPRLRTDMRNKGNGIIRDYIMNRSITQSLMRRECGLRLSVMRSHKSNNVNQ